MDPSTQERIAHNEHLFREANERIRTAAEENDLAGPVPFVCECSDPSCTMLLRLTPEEYRAVRAHPRRFFSVPGHHGNEPGQVVLDAGEYVVIEKEGRTGEVVERLAEEVP